MQRFADMQMFRDGTFPSSAGQVATTTLLADMQTFVLPDVLEDPCSPANLRYQARSLLAQSVRASSEPVMVVSGQAQGSRFEPRIL